MNCALRFFSYDFTFPADEIPQWSTLVERWYQLDPFSYGLAEAYWRLRNQMCVPEIMFLASSGGSFETDVSFSNSPTFNPAKFVHTLPNIRSSSLCQVMKWHGPVVCVQNGSSTLTSALGEALDWAVKEYKNLWIVGCQRAETCYRAEFLVLSTVLNERGAYAIRRRTTNESVTNGDAELRRFLRGDDQSTSFFISDKYEVVSG